MHKLVLALIPALVLLPAITLACNPETDATCHHDQRRNDATRGDWPCRGDWERRSWYQENERQWYRERCE